MKKILCVILACIIISCIVAPVISAEYKYPSAYWTYHQAYYDALEAKNDDKVIEIGKKILEILKNEPYGDVIPNIVNKYNDLYQIYQKREDYQEAVKYLKLYIEGCEYLFKTKIYPNDDAVRLGKAKLNHLELNIEIYAETGSTSHIPYYGAKVEPKNGLYVGRTNAADDNGGIPFSDSERLKLLYFHFGIENAEDFDWTFRQHDDEGRILIFAWNAKGENDDLAKVLSGKYDDHIISTLKYINTYKSPTMLRIFAEMNVWTKLADPESFRKAYMKIAKLTRQYAPDTALIFAPNCGSNWNVDIADYYPGDEYVDWVGVSLYTQKYFKASDPQPGKDFNEAYYNNGVYANPINKLRNIVNLYGDRKPILIQEGAAGYSISSKGIDLTDFAVEVNKKLYNYVSMIFPQVKAIVYFDLEMDKNSYGYKLSGNKKVKDNYFANINANKAVNASVSVPSDKAYIALKDYKEKSDVLNLATYAIFPTDAKTNVEYVLNGKSILKTSDAPFKCSIDTKTMTTGERKLEVKISNGKYTETKKYIIIKAKDGTISTKIDQ